MSYRNSANYHEFDHESGDLARKRSLVRPERSRIDQNHPRFHYTQVANQESNHLKILPSTTGLDPQISNPHSDRRASPSRSFHSPARELDDEDEGIPLMDIHSGNRVAPAASTNKPLPPDQEENGSSLHGGREVYGLNDEVENYSPAKSKVIASKEREPAPKAKHDIYLWKVYCYLITFWAPAPLLKLFGLSTKERQFAWREKIALISCILYLGAAIAFLIFGFTRTVCYNKTIRTRNGDVSKGYLIISGRAFELTSSQHPRAAGIGAGSNILYPPVDAGGKDASFLFQNVNGNCKNLITAKDSSSIPTNSDNDLAWYMPCRLFNQDGSSSPNKTKVYYDGWGCHTSSIAREAFYSLKVNGDVYFTWDDIRNSSRNLVVYSGNVLDLNLIDWILKDDLDYPELFDKLRTDDTYTGHDISMVLTNPHERQAARCLSEIIKVGTIDSDTIGCIASSIVLYVSLAFILSVVVAKFIMACYFKWVISIKQGATEVGNKSMVARNKEIENWADNPNGILGSQLKTVPVKARANYKSNKTNRQSVFYRGSRFSMDPNAELSQYYDNPEAMSKTFKYTTMCTQAATLGKGGSKRNNRISDARQSTLYMSEHGSSTDLLNRPMSAYNPFEAFDDRSAVNGLSPDIIHPDVVPQPPVEYQPFAYPLAHAITLVTCYSEDEGSLRLTMDSVATTDYPNSHKLIFVVCDGIIKGNGNDMFTPDIMLSMMSDFTTEPEDVKPYSYIAVAQGSKRHNMAKIYAGFYKYDDNTVPSEKQQRVPVICVVKCGTPDEASTSKPGNRGKRDSQVILMSYLQKVMFDERMTELEYELLNNIWRITGLMTEFYEVVLMVDADTKVFPDSMTHMVAEMVKDPSIMGLCGETKISNKNQSWVTMIQVFEYYISHHQSKAFESVFGGVTCLPGCFSMYRIKSPKGSDGYWVPVLANPDIVERYSDNNVSTLHKKNLLLLGEDRYLSALMLKTFPKRKQVFVPKAACKTVVPDSFKVLLSQRRRWINSTVHNLMELVLVNDLCGTFCFSMQFCIFIELIGTLVLPMAPCFTVYVIVFAIVSKPTPIVSLVLLAIVYGLPGSMIVITVSSVSYVLYFVIYVLALPVWNFALPIYAYWKFDDFSWGETRKVGNDTGDHSSVAGKFDASKIFMKRWREFERDRRQQEAQKLGASGNGLTVPSAAWDPSNSEKLLDEEYASDSVSP